MANVINVITVDGPSGVGKGTLALALAKRLGWHYLDSGALYRVLGLSAEQKKIALDDEENLAQEAAKLAVRFGADDAEVDANLGVRVFLEGIEVTQEIRTETAGNRASKVAKFPKVREALLQRQRDFAVAPGVIADGRDMGTVVFPNAPLKLFLTANAEERAKRRYNQLIQKGEDASIPALQQEIEERDLRDSQRVVAPLRPAEDAKVLDTTGIGIDAVLDTTLTWVKEAGIKSL